MNTYNAKDYNIMVDSVYITGVGEDMFTGEKDEDLIETSTGAKGDVCINQKNDPIGTMTITVQPTSPERKFLKSLKNRTEPFPIWATNKTMDERIGGTQALLRKYPSEERGATAEDMEFEFAVFDYTDE